MSGTPLVYVGGSTGDAAWNHPIGAQTSCGYSGTMSAGQCTALSLGILVENSSANDGWYGLPNSISGVAASSGDNAGLHSKVTLDVPG